MPSIVTSSVIPGAGSCRLPSRQQPNPLNLRVRAETGGWAARGRDSRLEGAIAERWTSGRPRREVERVVATQVIQENGRLSRVVRMDCDRGTAKCVTLTCQVYNLRANTSVIVEVKARLWNSTLQEDYQHVDRVEVVSKASVIVDPVYTQEVRNDYESIVTVALPELQLEPVAGPSWWIYLVAALCGLLVLLTIVLVLYKLGFFERKRPDDDTTDFMVSANFEKVRLSEDL